MPSSVLFVRAYRNLRQKSQAVLAIETNGTLDGKCACFGVHGEYKFIHFTLAPRVLAKSLALYLARTSTRNNLHHDSAIGFWPLDCFLSVPNWEVAFWTQGGFQLESQLKRILPTRSRLLCLLVAIV